MLSRKELMLAGKGAKDVPYPGSTYAYEAMNKLAKSLNVFKNKYNGKVYNILLSNGEECCFEMKDKNLTHLLGIDYKYIYNNKDFLFDVLKFKTLEQVNAYSTLERIVERSDDVIDNDELSFERLFNYYKIMVKASCFDKLSEFNDFNFGVIEFDKRIFEKYFDKELAPASTRYLFCESNEPAAPYCMMGLKYCNVNDDVMVPETFIVSPDFNKYIYRQELVLPIQLLINDETTLTKMEATPEEKIKMLNLYKSLIQTGDTDSFINIFSDYETVLQNSVTKTKAI